MKNRDTLRLVFNREFLKVITLAISGFDKEPDTQHYLAKHGLTTFFHIKADEIEIGDEFVTMNVELNRADRIDEDSLTRFRELAYWLRDMLVPLCRTVSLNLFE